MTERRLSFGSVAQQYDAARPSYPGPLVDDVIAYARVGPHDPIAEVGAGTGKATQLFAKHTDDLTAVEPSAEMAAVLTRKLPRVKLVHAGLEDANLPQHHFKLLYSGQAWHWVDPARRYELAHQALAPQGALACFWNWPDWAQSNLRADLDRIYAEAGVTTRVFGTHGLLDTDVWQRETAELFTDVELRRYAWAATFTAAEYVALLGTHSDHILLPAPEREMIFAKLTELIGAHGGSFDLPHSTRLALARRR